MAKKPERTEASWPACESIMVEALKGEGFSESLAVMIVAPIMQQITLTFPGERIYVPAPKRVYPVVEIVTAFTATRNREAVCSRFGISKSKLYEILKEAGEDSEDEHRAA